MAGVVTTTTAVGKAPAETDRTSLGWRPSRSALRDPSFDLRFAPHYPATTDPVTARDLAAEDETPKRRRRDAQLDSDLLRRQQPTALFFLLTRMTFHGAI